MVVFPFKTDLEALFSTIIHSENMYAIGTNESHLKTCK